VHNPAGTPGQSRNNSLSSAGIRTKMRAFKYGRGRHLV
jgi:hypothetical protein